MDTFLLASFNDKLPQLLLRYIAEQCTPALHFFLSEVMLLALISLSTIFSFDAASFRDSVANLTRFVEFSDWDIVVLSPFTARISLMGSAFAIARWRSMCILEFSSRRRLLVDKSWRPPFLLLFSDDMLL